MNVQYDCSGGPGPAVDEGPAGEGLRPPFPYAPERAPVCFGHEAGRGYFWHCRLCMLFHEGFALEEEARLMLRTHCELRRVEHCVGAAIRRKRAAGDTTDLTPAELSHALAHDPAAVWTSHTPGRNHRKAARDRVWS
ncbi:hypothetical protein [Streptomyces sp. NPDC086023]|uniref:hypothetical protein n=1 Tax=Streptomyces sp. NPDC086023 TaxID=3365746 RepID=UPI0037D6F333